jgi:hypothetical protein
VGVEAFQALASRALALARSESPQLSAVQIAANGGLRGLGEVESQMDLDETDEAGIILIAQLLGLFLTFLGEATTLRLIEDLRLQADVKTESVGASVNAAALEVDEAAMAMAFEDLLLEIDRLRGVGERIEILADNHPGMEQGLVSVAGNIRSIATVLDVFTLIRSKTGGPQEDPPNPTDVRLYELSSASAPFRAPCSCLDVPRPNREGRLRIDVRLAPPARRITVIRICYLEQCRVEHGDFPKNARFGPVSSFIRRHVGQVLRVNGVCDSSRL